MTYNVFGGTLSLTQSISHCLPQWNYWRQCPMLLAEFTPTLVGAVCRRSERGRTPRTSWVTRRQASMSWRCTWPHWQETSDAWKPTSSRCTLISTRLWTHDAPPTNAPTASRWRSIAWQRNWDRSAAEQSLRTTVYLGKNTNFDKTRVILIKFGTFR